MENQNQNQDPTEVEFEEKPKWYKDHKFWYLVLGILLLAVVIGSFLWWEEIKKTLPGKVETCAEKKSAGGEGCQEFILVDETRDWKTYTNAEYGFEFKYPPMLTLSENNDKVTLNHKIPYKNNGDCDMVGGDVTFDTLADFNITFELKPERVGLTFNDGPYKSGILDGVWVYGGPEGCGITSYYFYNDDSTLVVEKDNVQALSGISPIWNKEEILKAPGVITPEESKQIFDQILSTFKFTGSNSKIYTSTEMGLELTYPQGFEITSRTSTVYIAKDNVEFYEIGSSNAFMQITSDKDLISTFEKQVDLLKNVKRSNISLGNRSFQKIEGDDYGRYEGTSAGKIVEIFDNSLWIHIEERPGNKTQNFDVISRSEQIISTFKFLESPTTGIFCGGIAAFMCPDGYTCKYEGNYPDAGGTCVAVATKP